MAEPRVSVHLFCEDVAHERFLGGLAERLAREEAVEIDLESGNARGGHGKVLQELDLHQRALRHRGGLPDLLLVGIDANCKGWSRARRDVEERIATDLFPDHALAIPDPHIERWFLADPKALYAITEARVTVERRKCERDHYKSRLVEALDRAGHVVTLGGAEFAREIVETIDLFKAGREEPSLKSVVEDLRLCFRRWNRTAAKRDEP